MSRFTNGPRKPPRYRRAGASASAPARSVSWREFFCTAADHYEQTFRRGGVPVRPSLLNFYRHVARLADRGVATRLETLESAVEQLAYPEALFASEAIAAHRDQFREQGRYAFDALLGRIVRRLSAHANALENSLSAQGKAAALARVEGVRAALEKALQE